MPVETASAKERDLVDLVYAAMLGEESWTSFLEQLTSDIPGGKATMQLFDHQQPAESFVALQTGWDNSALKAYTNYYNVFNVLQTSLALRNSETGHVDIDLVPQDQLFGGTFYNEWLVPNGARASAGLKMGINGAKHVSLTVLSEQSNETVRRGMSNRLTYLAPHLRRAYQYYQRQPTDILREGLGASFLATSYAGLIVVDQYCKVQAMNTRAEAQLNSQKTPFRMNMSRLLSRDETISELLRKLLSVGYDGRSVITCPLPGSRVTLIRIKREDMSLLVHGVSIIIIVETVDQGALEFDEDLLRLEYGLTSAELRATRGIVARMTPAEIAAKFGLSRETIRAQIRSLYAKTGSNSQADIIKLVQVQRQHFEPQLKRFEERLNRKA